MANLMEMKMEIMLFLTILFVGVMVYKLVSSLKNYLMDASGREETDERYKYRAFLDDTTTDIENYLVNGPD
jgi:hypothetical protein